MRGDGGRREEGREGEKGGESEGGREREEEMGSVGGREGERGSEERTLMSKYYRTYSCKR